MAESAERYAAYRRSDDRWMLGRFVVSTARLDDMLQTAATVDGAPTPEDRWPITVTPGGDISEGLDRVAAFVRGAGGRAFAVESLELKVATPDDVAPLAARLPSGVEWYFEVPIAGPYQPFVAAIRDAGGRAKLRTGGVTGDRFPSADAVIELVAVAVAAGVAFKATAGLHHPVRGDFPLSYAAGAPRHTMYGFINLLLATAQLRRNGDRAAARALLLDTGPGAFRIGDEALSWRGTPFGDDELGATRAGAFTSFGSCSFREPVDELTGVAR